MAKDYTSVRNAANRLIGKFGRQTITLRKITNTPGAEPWKPAQANTDTTVQAAAFKPKRREINGSRVQELDRMYMVAAADLTERPKPSSWLVIDGSETLSVVQTELIGPGDTDLAYMIQARQ